ncbi:MAG: SoxR reducing system RseC family protein [Eubacteriales bacterium]
MTQKGTVISTEGAFAVVQVRRDAACDGCHRQADGCTACSLLGAGQRNHVVKVANPVQAQAGDVVELEAPSARILFYAFMLFVLPVLLSLLAYGVSVWLGAESAVRILCGVGAFILAFAGIAAGLNRMAAGKPETVIVRVINQ